MAISTITADRIAETVNAAFPFSVVKRPLVCEVPVNDFETVKMETPIHGLFRDDRQDRLAYVGGQGVRDGYVPHTREDVIALTEAAATVFDGEVSLRTYFDRGHYVVVAPTDAKRLEVYGTVDNVFPTFMISAGYNGKAFTASLMMQRDLCRNLMELRAVSGVRRSIKHTAGLRGKMDRLIQDFAALHGAVDNVAGAIRTMESRTVRVADFIASVYGTTDADSSKNSRTRHNNLVESILNRLMRERQQTGRPDNTLHTATAWEMFNAIQGYSQHDANRHGDPSDFARILRATDDKAVQRAETLALAS